MGNHVTAKRKLKSMARRIEKSLYVLNHGQKDMSILDTAMYFKILTICSEEGIPFPLLECGNNYYLDGDNPQLYCILSKLADDYDIILDYENIYE